MTESKIEWTGRSDWNPVRGCSRVSPGCGGPGNHGGCYAEAMAARFSKPGMWGHGFAEMQNGKPRWTGKVELQEDRLLMPLSWRKPGFVFPNSTSDFFHEALSDAAIDKLWAVMAMCSHLTFQVLTKRPERARPYLSAPLRRNEIELAAERLRASVGQFCSPKWSFAWPIPNIWLGVSAERQQEADERIPHLLQTPAAVRFVSAEPLLGPIDLIGTLARWQDDPKRDRRHVRLGAQLIDWVIVGGESGANARAMHPDWARWLRDQCQAAGLAFFFKQWGEWASGFTHMGSGDRVFRQFTSFQQWVDKASGWVNGGICLDRQGAELKRGADFARARDDGSFPVTIMHRVGKKAAGRLLDGIEHNAIPSKVTA